MNFQDVLNTVAAGASDYSASKKLGISRQRFSTYRNEREFPSDPVLEKMAEVSGIDIEKIYFAVTAEKCHIPKVAEAFRNLASH